MSCNVLDPRRAQRRVVRLVPSHGVEMFEPNVSSKSLETSEEVLTTTSLWSGKRILRSARSLSSSSRRRSQCFDGGTSLYTVVVLLISQDKNLTRAFDQQVSSLETLLHCAKSTVAESLGKEQECYLPSASDELGQIEERSETPASESLGQVRHAIIEVLEPWEPSVYTRETF